MIFKFTYPFYLLFFTFTGFVIDGLVPSVLAASLPTRTEVISNIQQKHSRLNKKNIILNPVSDIKTAYMLTDFIQPIEFIKPIRKTPSALKPNKPTYHSPIISNTLKNLGENFLIENEDSIFLQDSLIVIGNTKQFLKETDLMLHDLSENIIVSLKLDSLVTNNKSLMQQTALLDTQLEPNTIRYETLSISEIYKNIINWNNLFYLIAAIICYSILRAIINFLLLQQKNKQISRSSRY